MRNRLERRRLTLRAAALCIVLVLLCGCLLPAFAEGPERTDSVPDQTWDEEIEDESAWDEEEDIRTAEPSKRTSMLRGPISSGSGSRTRLTAACPTRNRPWAAVKSF